MQIQSTPAAPPVLDKAHSDLKAACQQFESYFMDLMFKEMRKTVPQSGLTGDQSNQQGIFQDMMDQTLADNMSKRGDLGLSQMLYNQLAPTLGSGTTPAATGGPKVSTDTGQ